MKGIFLMNVEKFHVGAKEQRRGPWILFTEEYVNHVDYLFFINEEVYS